jgi:hypothetical protein
MTAAFAWIKRNPVLLAMIVIGVAYFCTWASLIATHASERTDVLMDSAMLGLVMTLLIVKIRRGFFSSPGGFSGLILVPGLAVIVMYMVRSWWKIGFLPTDLIPAVFGALICCAMLALGRNEAKHDQLEAESD